MEVQKKPCTHHWATHRQYSEDLQVQVHIPGAGPMHNCCCKRLNLPAKSTDSTCLAKIFFRPCGMTTDLPCILLTLSAPHTHLTLSYDPHMLLRMIGASKSPKIFCTHQQALPTRRTPLDTSLRRRTGANQSQNHLCALRQVMSTRQLCQPHADQHFQQAMLAHHTRQSPVGQQLHRNQTGAGFSPQHRCKEGLPHQRLLAKSWSAFHIRHQPMQGTTPQMMQRMF